MTALREAAQQALEALENHTAINFGSVCSGIEAASVAWHPLGWQAAWLAEIDPFPAAVLKHHYPDVPNLGDMTTLPNRILSGEVEAPDLFCGGTPCQAFSVAGLRKSLDDARGNLSLVFCEIANAIDHVRIGRGEQPCIVFWENVPGVLNTKDNAFGCFLAELAGEDRPLEPPGGRWKDAGYVLGPKRAIAWRACDAQYWELAQRRKRVFLVASAREGFDPAAVLFEWEGLRRDTAPSREAGENASTNVEVRTGSGSDTVATLMACHGQKQWLSNQEAFSGDYHVLQPQVYENHSTGRGTPLVPVAFSRNDDGRDATNDLAPTMRVAGRAGGMLGVATPLVPVIAGTLKANNGGVGWSNSQNSTGPTVMVPVPAVIQATAAVAVRTANTGANGHGFANEVTHTLDRVQGQAVIAAMQVRRLTPVECERLQGFPDGYTAIPWRKKPASECPDGPRYKALGNSWAVPVVRWIGKRIAKQLRQEARAIEVTHGIKDA